MPKTSIIQTRYATDKNGRFDIFRKSLDSLFLNTEKAEIIVVDNGILNDDDFISKRARHIKLDKPKTLGYCRNLGYKQSGGEYIVFIDDDIFVEKGWIDECIKLLNKKEKLIATPIHNPRVGRWELEKIGRNRLNMRAGSNCLVMKRKDFENIGLFIEKNVAYDGAEFCDRQVKKGYSVILTEKVLAKDMQFRKHGYL